MNEIEIIRSQLAVEQAHATDIVNACAAQFGSGQPPASEGAAARFREACVSYLVWVLARFEERDQTLTELLAARHPAGSLAVPQGTSREALSRLEAALAAGDPESARAAWREFARFFNSAWTQRRAALERALGARLSVADWRAAAAIDADSMLDERRRYGRVAAELPPGIELRPAGAPEPLSSSP